MARFIEVHIKGPEDTSLPVQANIDQVRFVYIETDGSTVISYMGGGSLAVTESYEQMSELLKEPELIEGLSIVDQVWPSCLKDPSASEYAKPKTEIEHQGLDHVLK